MSKRSRRAARLKWCEGPLPLLVLLDATADAELLARLFEAPVAVECAEVAPPPSTRHIAVRTGKR